MTTFTQHTAPEVRILARLIVQPNGCWHWTGVVDSKGYGRVGYKGRRGETLQRAAYDCFVGPIPDGHDVDHTCHSRDLTCVRQGTDCLHRRCGNPEHLEAISRDEHRERTKGRPSIPGERLRITHCPRGHAYDEENTRISGGRRFCKTCNRAAKARLRAQRKAAAA
ncbi:MAG TPA: HNH endonuclease [Phytomonospora sp.]